MMFNYPIETKHRQLSEVSQRRTASRLLFNKSEIASEVERRDSHNSVPRRFPALMGVGSSNGTTGKRRTMSDAG